MSAPGSWRDTVRGGYCALLFVVAATVVTVKVVKSSQVPWPTLPFSAAVRADGLIYVAGTLAQDGDIKAQTKKVLDDLSQTLQKAGSSLANVASVHVYLKKSERLRGDERGLPHVLAKRSAGADDDRRRSRRSRPRLSRCRWSRSRLAASASSFIRLTGSSRRTRTATASGRATRSSCPVSISRNGKDNSVVDGDMATQTKTVLDNAGADSQGRGLHVRQRRLVARLHHRPDQVPGHEQGLPDVFPERSAGSRDRRRAADRSAVSSGNHAYRNRLPKQVFTTPNADGTPGKPSAILSSAVKVGQPPLCVRHPRQHARTTKATWKRRRSKSSHASGARSRAAGFDWTNVVDGIVYITDVANFDAMNKGYRTIFSKDFPARATVRTGLVNADGLVEIMFVAAK